MIPTLLIHALGIAQAPSSTLSVSFEAPPTIVAGLPLVLPYRLVNLTNAETYADLGTNEAAWATVRIVDAQGATVASSRPEIEVPFSRGGDYIFSSFGPPSAYVRPGATAKGTLIPWLDTTNLAPGQYTLDVRVATTLRLGLPVKANEPAQGLQQSLRYPLEVTADRSAVSGRCVDLLAQIHNPKPKGGTADAVVRELCLADRSVALPLLKNDPAPWSRLQTEYVAKGLVPYATPNDMQVIALFAQRSRVSFFEALKLLERSPDPEVARIATEIGLGNGVTP